MKKILLVCLLLVTMVAGFSACGGSGSDDAALSGPDLDGDGIPDSLDPDADGDGFENDVDCNDLNTAVNPDAVDQPDADYADLNCDGMDGDLSKAVWVSAVDGNDGASGAIDAPVQTIAKAIDLAKADAANIKDVYVIEGTYAEDVTLTGNVGLFGGFGALSSGTRLRDAAKYVSKIAGVDDAQKYTLVMPLGAPVDVATTILVNSTSSAVDGVTIVSDNKGLGLMAVDSDILLSNSVLDGATPYAGMEVAINSVFVTTSAATKANNVVLKRNVFNMKGGDSISDGMNYGVLGLQGKDADGAMNIEVDSNSFFATGKAGGHVAIAVADEDDDSSDVDDVGDGYANISLLVKNNNIAMDVEGEMAIGVLAGFGPEIGVVPDQKTLIRIESAVIENNNVRIGGNVEGGVAAAVGFVRKEAVLKGNTFVVAPVGAAMSVGFISIVADVDVVSNTMFMDGKMAGVAMFGANDIDAISNKYVAQSPGEISDNIFYVTSDDVGCVVFGFQEMLMEDEASNVHLASPEVLTNNDIYFKSSCAASLIYGDRIAISPSNYNSVMSISDLNNKVGFLSDDPTIISGNISADPLFIDPANGDFHLQAGSPAEGMGAY